MKLFPFIVITLLAFLIYSNTMSSPFIFDDLITIVNNQNIKNLTDFGKIYQSAPLRFIGNLSFAINYHFSGLDVFPYHLTNLLIHILVGFSVFWFVSLLRITPNFKDKPISQYIFPLFTALLFISHPIQTQAVTYLSQRYASLASLFYLLTLILYTKTALLRNKNGTLKFLFFFGALITALLAMLTKEIAFTLPLILIIIEILFLSNSFRRFITALPWILPFFLLIFVINQTVRPGTGVKVIITDLPSAAQTLPITHKEYLSTQINVIRSYIRLLFLPINQNFDYDYSISRTFFEPVTILSFLFLLFLVLLAFFIRKKSRFISFGIIFFFLTLSIESSIILIADVIEEHRVYLPSVGFAIIVSFLLLSIIPYLNSLVFHKYDQKGAKLSLLIMSIIILTLSMATYQRNSIWRDDITLWADVVAKSPLKVRAIVHLAVAYTNKGMFDQGIAEFQKAAKLTPNDPVIFSNLATAYRDKEDLDQALYYYNQALTIDSADPKIIANRAVVLYKKGKVEEAISQLKKVIEKGGNSPEAHHFLGLIYLEQGKKDEAIVEFEKTIELNPDYPDSYYYLGVIFERDGKKDEAIKEYKRVLRTSPSHILALNSLGALYLNLGKIEEAVMILRKATSINPHSAESFNNLGVAYLQKGAITEAVEVFQKAIILSPKNALFYNNLGMAYTKQSKTKEAIAEYEKALAIKPDYSEAQKNLLNQR